MTGPNRDHGGRRPAAASNAGPGVMDRNPLLPATATHANMGPSTLDLLFLTLNCAKNLISVPVFAAHLQQALTRKAAGLPDLVVL